MKRPLTLVVLCFLSGSLVFAINAQTVQEIQRRANERVAADQAAREQRERTRDAQEQRAAALGQQANAENIKSSAAINKYAQRYNRDLTKDEARVIAVRPVDLTFYNSLKLDSNSGILRLVPHVDCDGSSVIPEVKKQCEKFSMPGNGSSYSFRERKYRVQRLGDVYFANGELEAGSRRTLGFLVRLGNIDIGLVSSNSPGMSEVMDFRAPEEFKQLETDWNTFNNGLSQNGYLYAKRVRLAAGSTYALRTMAYRGYSAQEFSGVTFNELDLDRRRDCVVVFRVLNVLEDGSATIIWRLIRDREGPKIKSGKSTEGSK